VILFTYFAFSTSICKHETIVQSCIIKFSWVNWSVCVQKYLNCSWFRNHLTDTHLRNFSHEWSKNIDSNFFWNILFTITQHGAGTKREHGKTFLAPVLQGLLSQKAIRATTRRTIARTRASCIRTIDVVISTFCENKPNASARCGNGTRASHRYEHTWHRLWFLCIEKGHSAFW